MRVKDNKGEKDEGSFGNVYIKEEELDESLEDSSSFLVKYNPLLWGLYLWMIPFVWKAFRKIITLNDIPKLSENLRCLAYYSRYKKVREKLPCCRAFKLFFSIVICFFWDFFRASFLTISLTATRLLTPLVLRKVLTGLKPPIDDSQVKSMNQLRDILPSHLQPRESDIFGNFRQDEVTVFYWLGLLAFLKFADAVLEPYKYFFLEKIELKAKGVVNALVFEKAIELSPEDDDQKGKILNFLNMDINFVCSHVARLDLFWNPFLVFFTSLYFLIDMIGYATLVGLIGPLFISVPLFFIIGGFLLFMRQKLLGLTDKRIHMMTNAFHQLKTDSSRKTESSKRDKNIKDLKKSSLWDVLKTRDNEVCYQRMLGVVIQLFMSLARSTPIFMIVVVIISHYMIDGEISITDLYASFGLFMNLSRIVVIPMIIIAYVVHYPSFKRIDDLLEYKSTKKDDVEIESDSENDDNTIIVLKNATFQKKIKDEEKKKKNNSGICGICKKIFGKKEKDKVFELRNLNVNIQVGSFVLIKGPKNSGKTSLLQALLNDMKLIRGQRYVSKSVISYLPETPYILCGSLLQNITMFRTSDSSEVDEEFFDLIVDRCNLRDFVNTYSREVNIGESLRKLSEIEKFLISISRCLYSKNSVVFVDDPLIDSEEGDIKEVVGLVRNLLMSLKYITPDAFGTTILVCVDSSRKSILDALVPLADTILTLEDGEILDCRENPATTDISSDSFVSFTTDEGDEEEETRELEETTDYATATTTEIEITASDDTIDDDDVETSKEIEEGGEEMESETDSFSESTTEEDNKTEIKTTDISSVDISELNLEERPVGTVTRKVVLSFFKYMLPCHSIWFTISLLLVISVIDTCFGTGTQWYFTNMSSGQYFHRKYGTDFTSTYYENITESGSSFQYYNPDEMSCPASTSEYSIHCDSQIVSIYWNSRFKNSTIIKEGISYGESLGVFCVLTLSGIFSSFIRILIIINLFLTSSNYFFKAITRGLYKKLSAKKNQMEFEEEEEEIQSSSPTDISNVFKERDINDESESESENYFKNQPVGRLISRLSKDVGMVDSGIGRSFDQVFSTIITGILSIIVMSFTTFGLASIPLVCVAPLYFFLFWIYHRTPRELKRLESIARSRVFVSMDTSFMGRAVIRAYGKKKEIRDHHCKKYVNVEHRISFMTNGGRVWFWLYADMFGNLLFISITLLSIFLVYNWGVDSVFLLLAIHYSNSVAMYLGEFVYTLSSLETEMNALERIYFYYERLGN